MLVLAKAIAADHHTTEQHLFQVQVVFPVGIFLYEYVRIRIRRVLIREFTPVTYSDGSKYYRFRDGSDMYYYIDGDERFFPAGPLEPPAEVKVEVGEPEQVTIKSEPVELALPPVKVEQQDSDDLLLIKEEPIEDVLESD